MNQLDADEIIRLYQEGMSGPEIAEYLGTYCNKVYRVLHITGIAIRRIRTSARTLQRSAEAKALIAEGLTYEQVGERLHVTRQRAHQLVTKIGA